MPRLQRAFSLLALALALLPALGARRLQGPIWGVVETSDVRAPAAIGAKSMQSASGKLACKSSTSFMWSRRTCFSERRPCRMVSASFPPTHKITRSGFSF